MRRLLCSVKRLEEIEAIDRARKLSEEEAIWCRAVLSDAVMAEAARRIANMQREHGEESAVVQAALAEAEPIFEQGMERYEQKQAEEQARREAR